MAKKPLHERLATNAPLSDVAAALVEQANAGYEDARWWVEPYCRFGLTSQYLFDLERELANVVFPMRVIFANYTDAKGKRRPRFYLTYSEMDNLTKRQLFAFAMTRLIDQEYVGHIHRCKGCGTYFIADLRQQWCSTTCGSKHRVAKKRKLDKQRKGSKK